MTHSYFPNQGHKIALAWDNEANLRDWTAYTGADGLPFLPPSDRSGYTDGVSRRLNTGRVLKAGLPIVRLTLPWVSYGQLDTLQSTFDGENVTIEVHTPTDLNKDDVHTYNAVCNVDLNQVGSLSRKGKGYENFVVEFVAVEEL